MRIGNVRATDGTKEAARGPSIVAVLLGAVLLAGSLAAYLRWEQERALGGVRLAGEGAAVGPDGKARRPAAPPQVADVSKAVRAMQLVTVTLDTSVTVRARDESWRGNIDAEIRVPVRLYFGTDFSAASVESIRLGGGRGLVDAYVVRVPEPRRIATETYPELEQARVDAGWMRFRSIGGEEVLGHARRSLGEESRRMVLTLADQAMVRDQTRRRVEDLVRAIAGERASVRVEFVEAGWREGSPVGAEASATEAGAQR